MRRGLEAELRVGAFLQSLFREPFTVHARGVIDVELPSLLVQVKSTKSGWFRKAHPRGASPLERKELVRQAKRRGTFAVVAVVVDDQVAFRPARGPGWLDPIDPWARYPAPLWWRLQK